MGTYTSLSHEAFNMYNDERDNDVVQAGLDYALRNSVACKCFVLLLKCLPLLWQDGVKTISTTKIQLGSRQLIPNLREQTSFRKVLLEAFRRTCLTASDE